MRKSNGLSKFLALVSIIALIGHIIHLVVAWADVPDEIAIHFTNGEPDGWGPKFMLLIMPVIGLLIWWLLGLLEKHPDKLNYINLTDNNRDMQYNMAKKVIIVIQHLAFLTFLSANEAFLLYAIDANTTIFIVLSIALLVFIPIVLIYNLIWAARLKA